MRVSCDDTDPYSKVLQLMVAREFPNTTTLARGDLLELVFAEILGTKNTRFGPKPSVEAQVAMREVVRMCIASGLPIPFMAPWGSQKPDSSIATGSGADIAELMALKSMLSLQTRVQAHYSPGVNIRVRIEDASAPYLYHDQADAKREGAARYVRDMLGLVQILKLSPFITIVPETVLVTEAQFATEADTILPVMHRALTGFPGSDKELESLGWHGGINHEAQEFYLGQYEKLYAGDHASHLYRLARYWAAALARKRLKVRGDAPEWEGKFLDLAFVGPIPGTEGQFSRRVHYRTMPSNFTSNHMPPWRSKGYVLIEGDDEATPKLASFQEQHPYNRFVLKFQDEGGESVEVRSDYVLGGS